MKNAIMLTAALALTPVSAMADPGHTGQDVCVPRVVTKN